MVGRTCLSLRASAARSTATGSGELRDGSPKEWADAVAFDEAIRGGHVQPDGKVQLLGAAYLHSSLVPLAQADLSTPEDRGQLNLFEADCQSGVCGL